MSPASSTRRSPTTRSPCTRRRRRPRSPSCGAGGAASRSRSSRSAAARSARTSRFRSTACATSPARRSQLGERHGIPSLSFGHAGDGNIHSTFLFSPDDPDAGRARRRGLPRPVRAGAALGGTVTGEHGIGWLKRGKLPQQLGPVGYDLHTAIKQAFDPKGLLNPGKKR